MAVSRDMGHGPSPRFGNPKGASALREKLKRFLCKQKKKQKEKESRLIMVDNKYSKKGPADEFNPGPTVPQTAPCW